MTCIRLDPNTIVCINPGGRLKVGNRYVWLDFHPYCGPYFSWDRDGQKPYEPVDENDPVWKPFGVWLEKHQAAEARRIKRQQARKATS
jgi:hypothetical protein